MHGVGIISNYTAMKLMLKNKLYDELGEVIEKTLAAAEGRTAEIPIEEKENKA